MVEEKGVICPFVQYLLSTYYVTSPALGTQDTSGIQWTHVPAFRELAAEDWGGDGVSMRSLVDDGTSPMSPRMEHPRHSHRLGVPGIL